MLADSTTPLLNPSNECLNKFSDDTKYEPKKFEGKDSETTL